MTAKRLHIHARHRQHMGIITSLDDFDWREGEAVPAAGLPRQMRKSVRSSRGIVVAAIR